MRPPLLLLFLFLWLGVLDSACVRAAAVDEQGCAVRAGADVAELLAAAAAASAGGRLGEARRCLTIVLARDGGHEEATVRLVRMDLAEGNAVGAAERLSAAIGVAPRAAALYDLLAETYRSLDRGDAAVDVYGELVEQLPECQPCWLKLGYAASVAGRGEQAQAAFGQALALNETAEVYTSVAAFHERSGDLAQAVVAYGDAARVDPSNVQSLLRKGDVLLAQQAHAAAIEAYDAAVKRAPASAVPLLKLAKAHYQLKDFAAAEAACRRAIEADPNENMGYFNLGRILAASGEDRLREAAAQLEYYARRAANSVDAHEVLADVYERLGDLAGTIRHLVAAVRSDPQRWAVQLIQLGNRAIGARQMDAAADAYRAVADVMPDASVAWFNLAHAQRLAGNNSMAAVSISRAVVLEDAPKSRIVRAQTYFAMDMAERACDDYAAALKATGGRPAAQGDEQASYLSFTNLLETADACTRSRNVTIADEALTVAAARVDDARAESSPSTAIWADELVVARARSLRNRGRTFDAVALLAENDASFAAARLLSEWTDTLETRRYAAQLNDEAALSWLAAELAVANVNHVFHEDSIVLDYYSGFGLQAMLARKHGARDVLICEATSASAALTARVVAHNEAAMGPRDDDVEHVHVLPRPCGKLRRADLPGGNKADVVLLYNAIREQPTGELLRSVKYAQRYLLAKDAKVFPREAAVFAQLVEIELDPEEAALVRRGPVAPSARLGGLDFSPLRALTGRMLAGHSLAKLLEDGRVHARSDAVALASFNLQHFGLTYTSQAKRVPVTAAGRVTAVVYWFSLMGTQTILRSSTTARTAQIQVLPRAFDVAKDDQVDCTIRFDVETFALEVTPPGVERTSTPPRAASTDDDDLEAISA